MNTTPFPYSLPSASLDALHLAQQASALLAHLGDQVDGMPGIHQIGGMASVAGLIAVCLDRVLNEVDATSTLPMPSGEGQADAR